jgi:hypothetical protein
MNLMLAAFIGAVAGAHTSTWGMYKDSIHEGFTYPKYFRSIIVASMVGIAVVLATGLDLTRPGNIVVFFGITYAVERLLLELWKGFIRQEDQSKYFIPMQFHIGGRVVQSRGGRLLVGALVVGFIFLVGTWVFNLQPRHHDYPTWLLLVGIGSLGGWLTAFGGAWKDAPVEGFETLKFFRSPGIALFWAVLLAFFTDQLVYIALGAAGYSVATIETYKTFFFPNKPRGKFAGKPILYPEMLTRRQHFVPLYVAIWVGIVAMYLAAFATPSSGLLPRERAVVPPSFAQSLQSCPQAHCVSATSPTATASLYMRG